MSPSSRSECIPDKRQYKACVRKGIFDQKGSSKILKRILDNQADKGMLQGQHNCWELTTLWVARLDDGTELKVTDPEEQQGDIEEEEAEGEERRDRVNCSRRRAGCC